MPAWARSATSCGRWPRCWCSTVRLPCGGCARAGAHPWREPRGDRRWRMCVATEPDTKMPAPWGRHRVIAAGGAKSAVLALAAALDHAVTVLLLAASLDVAACSAARDG